VFVLIIFSPTVFHYRQSDLSVFLLSSFFFAENSSDHWGEGGSSTSPSSDTYRGPAAASEPEVQAIGRFFREEGKVIAGIDFHSFSQLVR
jgi:hypothetical protein